MTVLNQPNPAICNEAVVDEALKAILDAQLRTLRAADGRVITGWIWEIYRSIETSSVRIRMSDESGYVYHFNTLDVAFQTSPNS